MSCDVSVIICAYNHEKWIERSIRSVLNQTLVSDNSVEILVVNDASQDATKEIIEKFIDYPNIKIINNERNLGLPTSINIAIKQSSGRYIVRVDSDDYVQRNFIFFMKFYLDYNRFYQAVCVDYLVVNEFEEVLTRENAIKKEIACGVMFRRECLFDVGLYNEEYKMREGHDLRRRFTQKFTIGHLELPLYKYRDHENNRTKTNQVDDFNQKLNIEHGE